MGRYEEYQAVVDDHLLTPSIDNLKVLNGDVKIVNNTGDDVFIGLIKYTPAYGVAPVFSVISATAANISGAFVYSGKFTVFTPLYPTSVAGSGIQSYTVTTDPVSALNYIVILLNSINGDITITFD